VTNAVKSLGQDSLYKTLRLLTEVRVGHFSLDSYKDAYSTFYEVFRITTVDWGEIVYRFRESCVFQVYNFTLTLGDTSAIPSSIRVTVSGDAANWTVIINKTCSDTYYHRTSDTELTNCVVYVCGFLADRTAARCIIGYCHDTVVCPYVCDEVYCGTQGRCKGWRMHRL